MIERLLLKSHALFGDCELRFGPGLSVFTGVSGAGKSVLMSTILAVFGLKDSQASSVEADVVYDFDLENYGIENEKINVFKFSKDKSVRYFINNQAISKKNLTQIAQTHIKYLGTKSDDEFSNENILAMIDALVLQNEPKFRAKFDEFRLKFGEFLEVKKELEKIELEESKIEEMKEFAKFEIDKIQKINPKIGEFDELIETKKKLSKRDKMLSAWESAGRIFALEKSVIDALNISEIDSSFFSDAMNELREKMENLGLDELDSIDIEKVLDRIEALNHIIRRYGSEENALKSLEIKKKELAHYEDIDFEKEQLQKKFNALNSEINAIAKEISAKRISVKANFENIINKFLQKLYLSEISLNFTSKNIDFSGADESEISLMGASLKNLSSGEINRLKLAFIAANAEISQMGNGVIILDEIDANLSGKEAMSIADVLLEISKFYQIFAISHQPQLSSKAQNHFLITKNGAFSSIKLIQNNERITELARMISGEKISDEAMEFAKKLMNN